MSRASTLRQQIESSLATRAPGALSPRPRTMYEHTGFGLEAVDALIGGGVPMGAITEITGPPSCGRTTLALGLAAEITRSGRACAWVDVADAWDPESAAAAGVDLGLQLWVRCGVAPEGPPPVAPPRQAGHTPALLTQESRTPAPGGGGGSPHPRSEERGLSNAIGSLLQQYHRMPPKPLPPRRADKSIGTPGVANRPVVLPNAGGPHVREEQIATDRLPARRGDNLQLPQGRAQPAWPTGPHAAHGSQQPQSGPWPFGSSQQQQAALPSHPIDLPTQRRAQPVWTALDQALRAADLLLAAGGFSALVLDLGSTPAEFAWRVPLATWFRFRAAAERSRAAVVVLTQHPCTRSSAELVLRLSPATFHVETHLATGADFHLEVERRRFDSAGSLMGEQAISGAEKVVPIRKPPQPERYATPGHSAAWSRSAAWTPATQRAWKAGA